jgi:ATP-dependent Zn protease
MMTSTRPPLAAKLASLLVVLVSAAPMAAPAALAAPVAYQDESYAEFQQQLANGQIRAVTINKRVASLRVTLEDGRHVLAKYGHKEEPKAAAALEAKHVPVTVLSPAQAKSEVPKKAVHHKLRYIAGGILIVLILVVGAVLYMRSRRQPD